MQSFAMHAAPQMRRRNRTPSHSFHVRHAPFEIQPFFIAPVLPGETLENISIQSRVLSKPITGTLIGWWCEHYLFYVKHRDLDYYYENTVFQDMAINGTAITGATDYRTAATALFYGWRAGGTGMDWVQACLKVCVETFFRDQDQAWDAVTIDGNPAAYIGQTNAFQSALLESALDTATDVSIPVDAAPSPDTVSVRDIMNAVDTYNLLYQQGMVQITYEDWLRSYGVRSASAVVMKPELIRYLREWTYPAAHVVPDVTVAGDSDVTSALSWSIAERADKKRFFKEPGFVFGVTVVRPKMYLSKQLRPLVSLLDDAKSWLPAVLLNSPQASWKKSTDGTADVIGGQATSDWWIDLKDLFLHGDQFTNVAASAVDMNHVGLPSVALDMRQPVQADVDALFVAADATGAIKQDGIVRMTVATVLEETSPRGASVML